MFRHDGITVKDPHDIANCFNNYFSNKGAEQALKIKGCSNSFRDFLFDFSVNSIFFNPTNPIEVMRIVASLKSSHSTGHDEMIMNTHLLKNIIGSIIKHLVYIINLSFSSGSFPSMMKNSKIIPFYKDDASSFSNYLNTFMIRSFEYKLPSC